MYRNFSHWGSEIIVFAIQAHALVARVLAFTSEGFDEDSHQGETRTDLGAYNPRQALDNFW